MAITHKIEYPAKLSFIYNKQKVLKPIGRQLQKLVKSRIAAGKDADGKSAKIPKYSNSKRPLMDTKQMYQSIKPGKVTRKSKSIAAWPQGYRTKDQNKRARIKGKQKPNAVVAYSQAKEQNLDLFGLNDADTIFITRMIEDEIKAQIARDEAKLEQKATAKLQS